MIQEVDITIPPQFLNNTDYIKMVVAQKLLVSIQDIVQIQLLKRSIDARSKEPVYQLKIKVGIKEQFETPLFILNKTQPKANQKKVIIVGAGPAGLFAALQFIELGIQPILIERGKPVKERRRDLAAITKTGIVNPNSNYCYGEGGAGTYSDGKLYTRSNKRGDIQKILQLFVHFGANNDILINARPHIGTNKLPGIIENIRNFILNEGGKILFNTQLINIERSSNKINKIHLSTGEKVEVDYLILATGHSARDIYGLLYEHNILIESKPIAMGVRIEHPQQLIDSIQYHCNTRPESLPPAYYSLVEQVENRGVFSFCMCPGGIIAPCATNANEIVVNGWSPSKRNNPFANSGMVVQIQLEDINGNSSDPLKVLKFQQELEQRAFLLGGGNLKAPAQRMEDFVNGKVSSGLLETSYFPGVSSVSMDDLFPSFIAKRMKLAFSAFGKKMKAYYTNEAILVGVESRTSSPIRIPRDTVKLNHPEISNLYPCAEGAGYAGGIISAAIDGQRCAVEISKLIS